MLNPNEFIPSRKIAAWFVNNIDRDAGEAITHLKVQKLAFYAEAWFLANFDRSLTNEHFKAWAHGPVAQTIYNKYRSKGYSALGPEARPQLSDDIRDYLQAVYNEYGQFSAKRLEALTHSEDPWKVTRGNLAPEAKCNRPIDRLLIRNYYAAQIGKSALEELPNQT